jgi:hypothetical protein
MVDATSLIQAQTQAAHHNIHLTSLIWMSLTGDAAMQIQAAHDDSHATTKLGSGLGLGLESGDGSHATSLAQAQTPTWPANLVEIIQSAMSMKIHKPTKPEFAFDMSMEAAERNYLLLKKYDGSLAVALQVQGNSPLGIGSEFRPIDVLQVIYGWHPIWERMVSS